MSTPIHYHQKFQLLSARVLGCRVQTTRQRLGIHRRGRYFNHAAVGQAVIVRHDGAPQATVEALVYGLREGIAALPEHPNRQRRLSELSRGQLSEVCERIQKFKPHIAPAWTPDEVQALVTIWGQTHG
jgi:hypothetical protein